MSISKTLVVGIGSPHGDDQAGWQVADRLAAIEVAQCRARVRKARSPTDLLDWLDVVERLIVCDACHGLGLIGQLRRWEWPSRELSDVAWSGTHDLPLPAVLQLASKLGCLPKHVVVWGVEAAEQAVMTAMSPAVVAALQKLADAIVGELEVVPSNDTGTDKRTSRRQTGGSSATGHDHPMCRH